MITQAVDPHHFIRRARQIKARIPFLLSQWGLLPKFKRWRLAQDPDTGMVVLFAVLNNKFIAMHTTTPFSDYFDPRLLRDLATELHVQVISSANDGLRYAFILESGQLGIPLMPVDAHEDHQVNQVSPKGIQAELIQRRTAPHQPHYFVLVEDVTMMHQRLDRFLKITNAHNATNNGSTPPLPDVLLMDQADFNQRMADYEANRNNNMS